MNEKVGAEKLSGFEPGNRVIDHEREDCDRSSQNICRAFLNGSPNGCRIDVFGM
mgnify:CR=1 FL=1